MPEATMAGLIGLATVVVNVVISVVVGSWARRRQARDDAAIQSEGSALVELARVRAEYLRRIERLEKRLDAKDEQINHLTDRLGVANVKIAEQAAKIADLEDDVIRLTREQTR